MTKRKVFWVLVIFLLLIRIIYYFVLPDVCTDHLSQMAMAQNFMEGNGFSFKYLDSQKEIYYATHIQWPPLYPFVIALVTFMTADTLLSSFIIQILVILSLVIIWKNVFKLLTNLVSEEAYFYFISLVLISTSLLNNINTVLIFALLLLSVSLYFFFKYFFQQESKLYVILSSFFAALLFWTHYSYFFVAFYPAIVLFIMFYVRKQKYHLSNGLSAFAVSLVLTSGVLIYNYITTGSINYMDNPDVWIAGFYPDKLLRTDPFFVKAFFNSGYLPANLFFFSKNYHGSLNLFFHIISIGLITFIIIILLKLKKDKSLSFEKIYQLVIPFFVVIGATISFLLYFTLHYHEISNPGFTHLGDARYLSAIYISVIAIILVLIFIKADHLHKKIIQTFKVVLISLIIINVFVNIYLLADNWNIHNFRGRNIKTERDYEELFDSMYKVSDMGSQPIFINNNLTVLSARVSQYAGAAVIDAAEVTKIVRLPEDMVFFFILPESNYYKNEDYQLVEWSKRFNVENIGKVDSNFHLLKVYNK